MSKRCLESVPRVKKVSRTLRAHSRDTFRTLRSPWPEWPRGHPPGHSAKDPNLWGHSVRHCRGHSGPKGPRDSCRGPTMSQIVGWEWFGMGGWEGGMDGGGGSGGAASLNLGMGIFTLSCIHLGHTPQRSYSPKGRGSTFPKPPSSKPHSKNP